MVIEPMDKIGEKELKEAVGASIPEKPLRKVLLVPPDATRLYSLAGKITALYYHYLKDRAEVHIMPALGTHQPMTREECEAFFGKEIPFERILVHRWREDVVKLGEVPADFVSEVSEGLVNTAVPVEVNRALLDPSYDLILSIGQVVPHEVVGMANYSKNIFVGLGGSGMINSSHMIGAYYGMERTMGKDFSPVRKIFDYAEAHFLADLPLQYVLTVTEKTGEDLKLKGLYIGRERKFFEKAVLKSRETNITYVEKPIRKAVVFLDPVEFKSTWLGNKAVYRTRMAMAQGGELVVLAPAVSRFGEDDENDRLIRKYGYVGREQVLALVNRERELSENLSAAAHLIHGSSDGHFQVTYATSLLTKEEVEQVNYNYMPYREAYERYRPDTLKEGWNTLPNGEEIYYIENPALGLWSIKEGNHS